MQDIPVLTDLIQPASPRHIPVQATQRAAPLSEAEAAPNERFLQFFWNVEQLRQRLYEKFNYKVSRRIENFTDGGSCVKLICPAYGKGEPGSQPRQTTLSVGTNSEPWEMDVGLSYLQDALEFFIRRQQMTAVANDVITHLTPEQREALRWTLTELKA